MNSLSGRVVSPDLRTKLLKLASVPPSPLNVVKYDAEQGTLCSDTLRNVIRARIWAMMQKTLYNPRTAPRIKPIKAVGDVIHSRKPDEMLDDSPSLHTDFDLRPHKEELYNPLATEECLSRGDLDILEYDDLDFDTLINSGRSEDLESGDEALLENDNEYLDHDDRKTSLNQQNAHRPDHTAQQLRIPSLLEADNGSHSNLPKFRGVDHLTTKDDDWITAQAGGIGRAHKEETHSPHRHCPRSGARSGTPNDGLTVTHESPSGTQRSDDDEDILVHGESVTGMEGILFSVSDTPSSPNNNSFFRHEHLIQTGRLDENQDLLLPYDPPFGIVDCRGGRNEYTSTDEHEDDMMDI